MTGVAARPLAAPLAEDVSVFEDPADGVNGA